MFNRTYSHLLPYIFQQSLVVWCMYEQKERNTLKRRKLIQKARNANINRYGGVEKTFLEFEFILKCLHLFPNKAKTLFAYTAHFK